MKASVSSPDLDKQTELLKYYPELVSKIYKPALQSAVRMIEDVIRPNIPIGNTGRLEGTFKSKVTGRLYSTIKGQIGWFDKTPLYANLLENGAGPHTIEPRGSRISKKRSDAGGGATSRLRWPSGWDGGDWAYRSVVHHPGFSAMHFMALGYAELQPIVEVKINEAGQLIVREMGVK
jgi:hypothetical protein